MGLDLRRFRPQEYAVGTDGTITISLKDSAGDPLGVVGASAKWWLYEAVTRRRRKPFTGTPRLTKTSAAGEIALTTGQAVVTIDAADLPNRDGQHWQALHITDSSGNVTHLGQGEVFLLADPTA